MEELTLESAIVIGVRNEADPELGTQWVGANLRGSLDDNVCSRLPAA